ncbi:MAG: hypothetical protein ACLFU9_08075 [Candidatus Bathyarchaeia archaeon]
MEEKTIRNIPAVPFAVMMGAINAVIGFIAGIFMAIFWTAMFSMIPTGTDINLAGLGLLFGAGAIIIMPIMGFIGGLIQGLIIAVIYNFLAPRIGGIRLRFEEERRPPSPP